MADKYEVIINDRGEIELPEEIIKAFDAVRTISQTIKELEAQKKAIEEPLKKAMLKHGVEKFKCPYMSASTVKGSAYDAINTEKMKADGVYDKYAIHMTKADYVTIRYKKDEKND